MTVHTYLFFDGSCEEAIRFYGEAFGAELEYLMRFKEGPAELQVPGWEEKVLHARVSFGESALDMSDARPGEQAAFSGFALIMHLDQIERAEEVFAALGMGGQVLLPLAPTFWARRYGIVKDRFGVTWKVQVSQ
jgi:PhnB protein